MKKLMKHLPGLVLALTVVLFLASGNGLQASAAPTGTPWSGGTITQSGSYYLDISGDTLQLTDVISIGSNLDVTIDLNGKTVKGAAAKRCFYVQGNLTLSNGTVTGAGTAVSGKGGNIQVNAGTLSLSSVNVTGGKATSGGGNIYVTAHGTVRLLSGSTVSNGDAETGGNISVMYSTLEISGGTVTGGIATDADNIYLTGDATSGKGSSTLRITSGEVDAGNSTSSGDSIMASGSNNCETVVEISGGTLRGKTFLKRIKNSVLSGTPVIEDLHLADGMLVTPRNLSKGASITVQTNTASKAITGTLTNAESVAQYFHAYTAGEGVATAGGVLKVGVVCPCCNALTSDLTWTTVTGSTNFTSGHYKLTGNITLDAQKTISAQKSVTIDLNNYILTAASDSRCFYAEGTLNIIDSGENGTITGGNVKGTGEVDNESTRGGNIYVPTSGALHVFDGNITGGKATRGGNIATVGKTYIHGGTVENGTASSSRFGYNIYVQHSTGTLYITGGTIAATTDGKDSIVSMYSTIDISGGVIEGGIGVSGASNQYSTLRISGGVINGSVTTSGANTAGTAPEVAISGGTLNGITTITGARIFSLSGAPVINKLNLSAGVLISLGQLSQNASIAELNAIGVFTAPLNNAEAYLAWLADTITPQTVTAPENQNRLVMENSTVSTANGTDGNISWSLTGDGVLHLSGSGGMKDYSYSTNSLFTYSNTPWKNYLGQIKLVEIESGVTSIGNNAFAGCANLTAITFGNSLTGISSSAFTDTAMGVVLFSGTANQWAEKNSLVDNINNASVKILGGEALPGSNISYTLSDGGTLTITGTGAMPNYYYDSELTSLVGTPWKDQADEITSVVIEGGITSVGSWAFYDLKNLTSVTIPTSVTTIGNNAFRGCADLTAISIPGSVTAVRQGAFTQTGLQEVTYGGTITQWDTITVENYNEPLTGADFTFVELEVESIAVKENPTDTVYCVGQTLDTTGLVVTVTYSNGSTEEITQDYEVSYDFSAAGTQTVTVIYAEKTATFQVTVGIKGDVDGNGSVTNNDAVYVLWYIEGSLELPYEDFADFDGNGSVTKNDAVYILWFIEGKLA